MKSSIATFLIAAAILMGGAPRTQAQFLRVNTNGLVLSTNFWSSNAVSYIQVLTSRGVKTNAATTSLDGYLSSTDFTAFSNKLGASYSNQMKSTLTSSNLVFGSVTNFAINTNLLTFFGAGNATNNVLHVYNSTLNVLTNEQFGSRVIFQNPTYFLQNRGDGNQYSAPSLLGPWSIVNGASPAPTSGYGVSINLAAVRFEGDFTSTNLAARTADATATILPPLTVNSGVIHSTNTIIVKNSPHGGFDGTYLWLNSTPGVGDVPMGAVWKKVGSETNFVVLNDENNYVTPFTASGNQWTMQHESNDISGTLRFYLPYSDSPSGRGWKDINTDESFFGMQVYYYNPTNVIVASYPLVSGLVSNFTGKVIWLSGETGLDGNDGSSPLNAVRSWDEAMSRAATNATPGNPVTVAVLPAKYRKSGISQFSLVPNVNVVGIGMPEFNNQLNINLATNILIKDIHLKYVGIWTNIYPGQTSGPPTTAIVGNKGPGTVNPGYLILDGVRMNSFADTLHFGGSAGLKVYARNCEFTSTYDGVFGGLGDWLFENCTFVSTNYNNTNTFWSQLDCVAFPGGGNMTFRNCNFFLAGIPAGALGTTNAAIFIGSGAAGGSVTVDNCMFNWRGATNGVPFDHRMLTNCSVTYNFIDEQGRRYIGSGQRHQGWNVPESFWPTNFISGRSYTNTGKQTILASATIRLTGAAAAGNARMDAAYGADGSLVGIRSNTVSFSQLGTSEVRTNLLPLSILVPPGGAYWFTNKSDGSGNLSEIVTGTGLIQVIN